MELVRQLGQKVSVHVRAGGKAVDQQQRRQARITGLAIEHLDAVCGNESMMDGRTRIERHGRGPSGR
ncbi:hypothetical protein [Lysobacter niastensis]|uniref:hypothetical protein n=1 Tax=Lysobacter niastensis TaxID=380629 RepID=UPI001E356725|nr:hypothetical protein [Lysobacter niastensis]